MKLGITMPTRTVELRRVGQYAKWAEEAGLDSAWDWELYRNPFTMLTMAALETDRVMLGTGLSVAGSRSPFEMANVAADIDDLSNGRMLLGIGSGVTEFLGAFHCNPNNKPLTRMTEYIECLRLSWQYLSNGDTPSFEGEFYQFVSPPKYWPPSTPAAWPSREAVSRWPTPDPAISSIWCPLCSAAGPKAPTVHRRSWTA